MEFNGHYLVVVLLFSILSVHVGGQITQPPCGGNLVATSTIGITSTPLYPALYPPLLDCTWIILATTPGAQVEIQFTGILTEVCCDVITIRDGSTADAPEMDNFRGNVSIRNYMSSHGAIYVNFVSDEDISGIGFRLLYKETIPPTPSLCGGKLTATFQNQTISTLGYPIVNYASNSYCLWTICAPQGSRILLTLLNGASIEPCCDSLYMRDGSQDSSPFIAYLSGNLTTRHLNFRSTENCVQVRFRSDGTVNYGGFRMIYTISTTTDPPDINPPMMTTSCEHALKTTIAAGTQNFTSPNYPDLHAPNLMCSWTISAPVGERVRVWFAYINTERCCDWIKVRDGSLPSSPKLGVISGNPDRFSSFVSTSNVIRVEFDSDSIANGRGFIAYYETHVAGDDERTSECGGELEADSSIQFFSSPNWPEPYDSSVTCEWVIVADRTLNEVIEIRILGFLTEGENADTLEFYDGRVTGYPSFILPYFRLLRLSGRFRITDDNHFRGRSSEMTVIFRSDFLINHGGFRASYQAVPSSSKGFF